MSLQYLLDGYNIINQMPGLTQRKLEDKRRHFLGMLEQSRPQGSVRNKLTVVFDGKSEVFGSESRSSVKVIFTSDETADEEIKRRVAAADNKKNIVVVTDDRDIQYYVRALGATVVSVKDFIGKFKTDGAKTRSTGKKAISPASAKKKISKTAEYRINSELEEIWLKKGKARKK